MNLIEKVFAAGVTDLTIPTTPQTTSISGLASKITDLLGIVAGALAFIYLIYSGILYITANGNTEQSKKAQSGLINAIIGLVIIALAYTIFKVVFNQASNLGTAV